MSDGKNTEGLSLINKKKPQAVRSEIQERNTRFCQIRFSLP
jgi:hypothetical protein